ncbi:MAG: hypothetical protein ACTSO3_00935 [Candidatus Heimdallarchaeaceae archaeon]
MTIEFGFNIKCPTCSTFMFVPMDTFDGNFGEITGKCPHCKRKAYVMVLVCDDEKRKKENENEESECERKSEAKEEHTENHEEKKQASS